MTFPARRPWWKKKRWAAALAVLLAAGYPASLGPVVYGAGRGWPVGRVWPLYAPLVTPSFRDGPLGETYGRYLLWWLWWADQTDAATDWRPAALVESLPPSPEGAAAMDETKPKKARWPEKRWRAAAAVVLLAAYPSSAGPAAYLQVQRGMPGQVSSVVRSFGLRRAPWTRRR